MIKNNTRDQQLSLEERVTSLEKKFMKLEVAIIQRRELSMHPKGESRKKLSIKEFLIEKAPRSNREKTLSIAYYIEKHETVIPFNIRDLESGFRAAEIPPPQNTNDMVNKNIERGMLMESAEKKDNRKSWELTATGELAVEQGFA